MSNSIETSDKQNIFHTEDVDSKQDYNATPTIEERIKTMTSQEKAEALAAAQKLDPGLPFWSKRGFMFIGIMLALFICGGDSGLDTNVMASVNSMGQWQRFFGLGAATPRTGIVFGMYNVGGVAAFLTNVWFPDRFGRTKGVFLGNMFVIAGGIVNALAPNMGVFLLGRFLCGYGCSAAGHSAKTYVVEMASPKYRGLLGGGYNCFYHIGSILVSGVSIPLGLQKGDISWRMLLAIQAMFPIFNVVPILFFPESPRWLYTHGKKEECLKVLAKYHSRDNDINSPLVQYEYAEIVESVALEGTDKKWWDLKVLVATKSARYRMAIATFVSFWGQLAGPANNYFTVLLQVAGITDGNKQRVMNLGNAVTIFVSATAGATTVDYVGRRFLMLTATGCGSIGMFIIGGLLSGNPSPTRATTGIAFIYLFGVFVQYGWTPLNTLYNPEVLSYEMRVKGLAVQQLLNVCAQLINTFALPAILTSIYWKTYLIFGAFDAIGFVIAYRYAVETMGIPLEQLDEVFEHENPKKHSLYLVKTAKERRKLEKKMAAEVTDA